MLRMNETLVVQPCLPTAPCERADQGLQSDHDGWGNEVVPEPSAWLRFLHRLRIHRVVWLYGFLLECRSLCYRMARLRQTDLYRTGLDIGPAFDPTENGSSQECTRTHACTRDMQNFYAKRPGATIFDIELFLAGWKAGSAFERGNGDIEKCDRFEVSSACDR
jgi:hypothetical protein